MYKPLEGSGHDVKTRTLTQKYVYIFFVVALYWFVSIVTVFVNKALLSSSTVNLNAPLFVTWFQCLVSTLICFTFSKLGKVFPRTISVPNGNPFKWETFKNVLPLSILFTAMIASNNLCLKYVGVAFYYIGRSLTTVFNVLLTYALLRQKTSLQCIICCGVVVFGFLLGVDQESLKVLNYEHLNESWFWMVMSIGGICGFSIGYVTSLQIKVTSPLTHNISGTAKACAQTVLATQWFNETKSFLWWTSNVVILLGSGIYARIKQLEIKQLHKESVFSQKI
uniref:Sugar phosphate transporter domain-containing protein n=1 Tax=Megaselia scalaris TaxID=36166 RepID=T1GK74_MEGSC